MKITHAVRKNLRIPPPALVALLDVLPTEFAILVFFAIPTDGIPFKGDCIAALSNSELERVLLIPVLALVRIHNFLQVAVSEILGILEYLFQLPLKQRSDFHNPMFHT